MKVLVFSDSHGYKNKLITMLDKEKDSDFCFFLGDGLREAQEVAELYPQIKFIFVKGNNDFYSLQEKEAYKYIDGITFMACHGDELNVRRGLLDLLEKAQSVRANIALYGHTHIRNKYKDSRTGVFALNPGALCEGQYSIIFTERGNFTVEEKYI